MSHRFDQGHTPRKRFGQNFLHDNAIILSIIHAIGPKATDNLVEIGPGLGALTNELIAHCNALKVIELDRDLIPKLQQQFSAFPDFKIFQGDVLKFDFSQLADEERSLRIVGNLPYNISTPLIFHLLQYRRLIKDMHFMLQKEVVERLVAEPGSRDYGRLGIMVQYYCQAVSLIEVPPTAFRPMPQVDSAVVRLTPYTELPIVAKNIGHLELVVKKAFNQRRKTIRNALKELVSAELLEHLEIDPNLRPENLSLQQLVTISNQIA